MNWKYLLKQIGSAAAYGFLIMFFVVSFAAWKGGYGLKIYLEGLIVLIPIGIFSGLLSLSRLGSSGKVFYSKQLFPQGKEEDKIKYGGITSLLVLGVVLLFVFIFLVLPLFA